MRRGFFLSLAAGMYLHVFVDLFQLKPDNGYTIFYPLSPYKYSFQVFWNDKWPYWIVFFTLLLVCLGLFRMTRKAGFSSAFRVDV